MQESNSENFNHLKIHSQFSICEGAIKIDDLKDISKHKKLKALGLCDTSNLCGALEFAEKLSKSGSQPIIGTQINFKLNDTTGLLPLFALNEDGYKTIIKLSSLSFLKNDELSDPHLDLNELLNNNEGVAIFSGTIHGLFGQLFNKGKFSEISEIFSKPDMYNIKAKKGRIHIKEKFNELLIAKQYEKLMIEVIRKHKTIIKGNNANL